MTSDYVMLRLRDLVSNPYWTFRDRKTEVTSFVKYLLNDEKNFVPSVLRPYFSRMLDRPLLLNHEREIVFGQMLMDEDTENVRTWCSFFMDGELLNPAVDETDMRALLALAQGVDTVNICGVLTKPESWLGTWACTTQVSVFDLDKDYSTLAGKSKARYDIKNAPEPTQTMLMAADDFDQYMPLMATGWGFCHKDSMGEFNGFQQAIIWRWVQAHQPTDNAMMIALYEEDKLACIIGAYKGCDHWQFTSLWQPHPSLTLTPMKGTYGISAIRTLIQYLKGSGETGSLLLTVPSLTGKTTSEKYETYKRKFEHRTMDVYSWFARNGSGGKPYFNLETQQAVLEDPA